MASALSLKASAAAPIRATIAQKRRWFIGGLKSPWSIWSQAASSTSSLGGCRDGRGDVLQVLAGLVAAAADAFEGWFCSGAHGVPTLWWLSTSAASSMLASNRIAARAAVIAERAPNPFGLGSLSGISSANRLR